ncbi:hypothetical protein SLNSH_11200 [Alsobacter soli]|uniref:Carboxypeptidase regulatory-like domain-containing protein n=1 Tax=Alsobacter soli TaxID=2109933 RepID=A0A2T1HTM7_9HYPH|nr:hypothetical protein [Alsobacter soli]PSC05005.1 hypothetical protein SLNSH_11200 [Alsobacter soli]
MVALFARLALSATVCAGLSACVTYQPLDTAFDDAMAAKAKAQLEPGMATIKGSAFLRKPSGSFVTAGGEWVYLIPATPYAEERFKRLFGEGRYNSAVWGNNAPPPDPRFSELMRKLKAHKDGSFRFENVKPGRYFVSSSLTWTPKDEILPHGGAVYDEVTVKGEEETADVVLSGK